MAEIKKKASAGTMESSDAYVEVEPAAGVEISVESVVLAQFGEQIRSSIEEVIKENDITGVRLRLADQGALDCVIRARVETALRRGKEA